MSVGERQIPFVVVGEKLMPVGGDGDKSAANVAAQFGVKADKHHNVPFLSEQLAQAAYRQLTAGSQNINPLIRTKL